VCEIMGHDTYIPLKTQAKISSSYSFCIPILKAQIRAPDVHTKLDTLSEHIGQHRYTMKRPPSL
jgi:hypothetical protein